MADNSLGAKVGVPVVLPVITNWTAYTPVISGTTTSPTRGTNVEIARWRRVGENMEIEYSYNQTAAGSAGSGNYLFAIPPGVTIDTAKLISTQSDLGHAYAFNGTSEYSGYVYPTSTTQVIVAIFTSISAAGAAGSALTSMANAALRIDFRVSIPIAEWAGSANVAYGAGLATSVKAGLYLAGAAPGIKSNVAAAVGDVGQVIQSSVIGVTVAAAAGISDITFIDLTEGDWDVSAMAVHNDTTGNTWLKIGISTASTSFAGLINGYNMGIGATGNVAGAGIACIPKVPIRIATGATVRHYLCGQYSALNQAVDASIVARRVR